jgi:hypothetical protein
MQIFNYVATTVNKPIMVRMKTVSLHSFYKRKQDESDVGEEEDQAPPILQLGDLKPQR